MNIEELNMTEGVEALKRGTQIPWSSAMTQRTVPGTRQLKSTLTAQLAAARDRILTLESHLSDRNAAIKGLTEDVGRAEGSAATVRNDAIRLTQTTRTGYPDGYYAYHCQPSKIAAAPPPC